MAGLFSDGNILTGLFQYLLFQIMTMIEQSQLEPIIKIRINESAKMELKTELAKMVDRATLDKGNTTKINFLFLFELAWFWSQNIWWNSKILGSDIFTLAPGTRATKMYSLAWLSTVYSTVIHCLQHVKIADLNSYSNYDPEWSSILTCFIGLNFRHTSE